MKSKSELLTEIQISEFKLRRETGLPVIDAEREVDSELAYQEAEDEKRRLLDWRNSKADIEERVRAEALAEIRNFIGREDWRPTNRAEGRRSEWETRLRRRFSLLPEKRQWR